MDGIELTLGIIGSATGVTALLVQVGQWLTDRSRIRLTGSLLITKTAKLPIEHLRLALSVMNRGKRPVRLSEAGIFVGNTWASVNGQRTPVESARLSFDHFKLNNTRLEEGDRKDLEVCPFNPSHVMCGRRRRMVLYAIDSLDREYRCKISVPTAESIKRLLDRDDAARAAGKAPQTANQAPNC